MPSLTRPLIGAHRDRAERYLVVTIAAFAVTVAGTRWYLDLTGYPTVGGGELHVAHVLWGGLALFVAVLLSMLYVGERAQLLSALLAGIGVGLFIDEVGKFLTTSNDYFFAPAAPIIYGSILLLVLLWLVLRRRTTSRLDAQHAAVEAIRDGIDGRLSADDRARVTAELRAAGQQADPDALSDQLLRTLGSPAMDARLVDAGWLERGGARQTLERLLPTRLERWLVYIGLVLSVLSALVAAVVLIGLYYEPDLLDFSQLDAGRLEIPTDPLWFGLALAVYVVTGVSALVALVLRVARRKTWLTAALAAVLIDLVVGELISFYVVQSGQLGSAFWSVVLLGLVVDLRIRQRHADAAAPAGSAAPADAAAPGDPADPAVPGDLAVQHADVAD